MVVTPWALIRVSWNIKMTIPNVMIKWTMDCPLLCSCPSYQPCIVHAECMFTSMLHVIHYSHVIMGVMASQITSLTIVYSTVYSVTDQRKHQSSASLSFVRGIHRWPVNSPYKWPVTRKMFPFDDVIMWIWSHQNEYRVSVVKLHVSVRQINTFGSLDPCLIANWWKWWWWKWWCWRWWWQLKAVRM